MRSQAKLPVPGITAREFKVLLLLPFTTALIPASAAGSVGLYAVSVMMFGTALTARIETVRRLRAFKKENL